MLKKAIKQYGIVDKVYVKIVRNNEYRSMPSVGIVKVDARCLIKQEL